MMSMTGFAETSGGVLTTQNHRKIDGNMTDPGSDVRGNIARLTARARQLLVNDTDTRVVRNGLSAYETSRKMASDVCTRARAPGQTSSTQASVELFMASLGFNLQEQQRLLQQLQASQLSLAAAAAAGGVGIVSEASGSFFPPHTEDELGSSLEAFVANCRKETMRRNVEEMHQRVGHLVQERTEDIIRAVWDKYSVEVADAFESYAIKSAGGGQLTRVKPPTNNTNAITPLQPRAGVMSLLKRRDSVSTRMLNKVATFAQIVDTQPPLRWLTHFAAHIADDTPSITDEVAVLWATVEQMLQPIMQHGSASTIMTYVASSRHMMERKALVSLLSRTLKVDSNRFGELENMHATRFIEAVQRYTSSSNPWAHIYTAMRCGRYDAAVMIANSAGFRLVEAKLEAYANAPMTQRSTLPSAMDLRQLYEEEATRLDPHRQIVLLLLLLGNTGESSDVVLSTVASLSSRVAHSLEDTLWIRLFCVRSVEVCGGDKLQSLAEMQRLLLDDMQELLALVRGDVVRLASLLIHALLPSSGMRLLIENDTTYVDGIHLAICFYISQLLPCGDVEVPIDLTRLIPQYCSLVLLDTDKRQVCITRTGAAIFRYFLCTNLVSVFVDYCGNELVCAKLFGQRGGSRAGSDGVLLQCTPSTELLEAMERVAEAAVLRGQTELAVHVFSVLESAAAHVHDENRANYALSRAVQIICPALSRAFHHPPTSESTNLFVHAANLQDRVVRSKRSIPHTHAEAFQLLCKMSEVFVSAARNESEVALHHFYSLPFIPASNEDVERCAELFDTTPECVDTATPPILMLAVQHMLRLAAEYKARGEETAMVQLRRRVHVLTMWARCWKKQHVGHRLTEELASLDKMFLL
ncbi:putative nucleoporin interacting component (NUP93) [Trypanosoma theileri]|uniref:Nuclear pore protein n=1 Tax=Trypanosoma theileri TaxID=67003 RepID=A0A1X0P8L0_9TRYP|nr:putative nucleoporin interacting component (NUP93) [Trypanosoma theileri]ORC92919.1 putative nucleoporin interacting component (NUP93) [Trypanosoma theileri]